MPAGQLAAFERDGYVIIPSALGADEVAYCTGALDQVYARESAAGRIAPGGPMHLLSAVSNCREVAGLVDHPATFPYIWSILGWNIHVYHSHLDVHPPIRAPNPFRFEWHQDGGRQNREIETDPRPRLSMKLGYWLSDVSAAGRGNLKVVPGSHLTNAIDGPPRRNIRWPDPEGAVEVTVRPGDVVCFDRRLWHSRSDNYSEITRKVIFIGYTYRWVASRDDVVPRHGLSPVQQQLLGCSWHGGDDAWGHDPNATPLYGYLSERGLLDAGNPPLKP